MLGALVVKEVVNLSFFTQLPEEHAFATSPKAANFIGSTLAAIAKLTSADNAASLYKASGA